jgi:heme exporter protein C
VRLTTVLILFLVFVAVLLARRFGGAASHRIAAGLCIFGAADVPLIYISVKLWRTIHPETTVVGSLPAKMKLAFFISLGVFTLLYVLLLWIRLRLERSRGELDALVVAVAERE